MTVRIFGDISYKQRFRLSYQQKSDSTHLEYSVVWNAFNTGGPQGCVLGPFLFTLRTYDHFPVMKTILKWTTVSSITNECMRWVHIKYCTFLCDIHPVESNHTRCTEKRMCGHRCLPEEMTVTVYSEFLTCSHVVPTAINFILKVSQSWRSLTCESDLRACNTLVSDFENRHLCVSLQDSTPACSSIPPKIVLSVPL